MVYGKFNYFTLDYNKYFIFIYLIFSTINPVNSDNNNKGHECFFSPLTGSYLNQTVLRCLGFHKNRSTLKLALLYIFLQQDFLANFLYQKTRFL